MPKPRCCAVTVPCCRRSSPPSPRPRERPAARSCSGQPPSAPASTPCCTCPSSIRRAALWRSRCTARPRDPSHPVNLPFTVAHDAGHCRFLASAARPPRASNLTDIPEGNTVKITRIGGAARLAGWGALALAGALALSSCAANEQPSGDGGTTGSTLSGTFNGAGASSQGSAQDAWVAAFQTANPEVTVNYDPRGSGAGRETFIGGGSDWAGSDSALSDEELAGSFGSCAADSKALDIPTYISPIAVIFNVEGVKELNLDAATLAKIFKGDITKWNDPAIAALNEGTSFPDQTI